MGKINDNNYNKVASDEIEKDDPVPPTYGYGVRHVQALLIFCCLCINFIARAHLSVTIVAMTDIPKRTNDTINANNEKFIKFGEFDSKNSSNNNSDTVFITSKVLYKSGFEGSVRISAVNKLNESVNDTERELTNFDLNNTVTEKVQNSTNINTTIWNVNSKYVWPKSTQEMILGAFFLGYMIMMSPMGLICQRWGGKLPLQIGLTVSGVVTLLTPWLAAWGDWKAVCASRVVMGLAQAGTYPGIHTLVAKWVPLSERGRLGTYVYIGSMIGAVIAFQLSGFLAESPLGWPSMYWVTGGICIIMAVLMTIFGAASPQQHKSITDQEKNFILGRMDSGVEKRLRTPWKAIFTSIPVWATFVAHIGTATSYLFLFAQIPTYLHYVLEVDIKSSGVLSSLPYLANFGTSIIFGQLADYYSNNKILSLKQTRMISNTCANVFPAICLASLSFTSNTALGVAFIIVALATHAGTHTGWMVNYIDLAPNFSGALMAIGNTMMNVSALLLPVFVSRVVIDVRDPYQWRIVMFSVAAFGLICNTVYVCFMSADVQPWNDAEYQAAAQEEDEATESSEKCKRNSTN